MPEHPTHPESSLTPAELSHEVASYIDTLKVQIHALCATYDIPITPSIPDTIQAFADKARAREIPPKALTHLLALFTAWSAAAETNRIPPELRASFGIPLERWAPQLNATLNEQLQSGKSAELKAAFPGIEFDPDPVEHSRTALPSPPTSAPPSSAPSSVDSPARYSSRVRTGKGSRPSSAPSQTPRTPRSTSPNALHQTPTASRTSPIISCIPARMRMAPTLYRASRPETRMVSTGRRTCIPNP